MRPPKDKWRLAAEVAEALLTLILSIHGVASLKAAGDARIAVDKFKQHVNESEECEMD